jgi:hypothetical protein
MFHALSLSTSFLFSVAYRPKFLILLFCHPRISFIVSHNTARTDLHVQLISELHIIFTLFTSNKKIAFPIYI